MVVGHRLIPDLPDDARDRLFMTLGGRSSNLPGT
jgi:hypothetical protein